jgi:hypothetical protein
MRPLLNASLLPKALISLRTCVEVVPVEVQEHVGMVWQTIRESEDGGNYGRRSSEVVAKGFGEREAVSEVRIQMFGGVLTHSGCIRTSDSPTGGVVVSVGPYG